jgi:hypothetical protein
MPYRVYLDGSIETDDPHEAIELAKLIKSQLTNLIQLPNFDPPIPNLEPTDKDMIGSYFKKKSTGRIIKIIDVIDGRCHIEVVKIGKGKKHSGGSRPIKPTYLERDYDYCDMPED